MVGWGPIDKKLTGRNRAGWGEEVAGWSGRDARGAGKMGEVVGGLPVGWRVVSLGKTFGIFFA